MQTTETLQAELLKQNSHLAELIAQIKSNTQNSQLQETNKMINSLQEQIREGMFFNSKLIKQIEINTRPVNNALQVKGSYNSTAAPRFAGSSGVIVD